MTRFWLPLCGVAALAACSPTVPDSAAGVGFGHYSQYQAVETDRAAQIDAGREGQLQTPLVLSPETTGAPRATTGEGTRPAISAGELAAAGIDISPDVRVNAGGQRIYGPPRSTAPTVGAPVLVAPITPGYATSTSGSAAPGTTATGTAAETPGTPLAATRTEAAAYGVAPAAATAAAQRPISDEQDFVAVSARETIESDADRLAAQRAQRQQVSADLPQRPASTGPDIVAFALSTSHPVGSKVYPRSFGSERKAARACARYTAPDVAQRAFLESGGPQRDRLGVDPDGDGFACGWNPAPFRNAVQG